VDYKRDISVEFDALPQFDTKKVNCSPAAIHFFVGYNCCVSTKNHSFIRYAEQQKQTEVISEILSPAVPSELSIITREPISRQIPNTK
jgi:hypothetical protein